MRIWPLEYCFLWLMLLQSLIKEGFKGLMVFSLLWRKTEINIYICQINFCHRLRSSIAASAQFGRSNNGFISLNFFNFKFLCKCHFFEIDCLACVPQISKTFDLIDLRFRSVSEKLKNSRLNDFLNTFYKRRELLPRDIKLSPYFRPWLQARFSSVSRTIWHHRSTCRPSWYSEVSNLKVLQQHAYQRAFQLHNRSSRSFLAAFYSCN